MSAELSRWPSWIQTPSMLPLFASLQTICFGWNLFCDGNTWRTAGPDPKNRSEENWTGSKMRWTWTDPNRERTTTLAAARRTDQLTSRLGWKGQRHESIFQTHVLVGWLRQTACDQSSAADILIHRSWSAATQRESAPPNTTEQNLDLALIRSLVSYHHQNIHSNNTWTLHKSAFILKHITFFSSSALLPPPNLQFLSLVSASHERERKRKRVRVFRSAQYPTETRVGETDRHMEDCQPAEIKAKAREIKKKKKKKTASLQQTDFQKKKKMQKMIKREARLHQSSIRVKTPKPSSVDLSELRCPDFLFSNCVISFCC